MKLIVESGATKTCWVAVSPGREPVEIKTAGINLASMRSDAIESIVIKAVDELKEKGISNDVEEVFFYAAGLIEQEGEKVPDLAKELDKVFTRLFPSAEIEYATVHSYPSCLHTVPLVRQGILCSARPAADRDMSSQPVQSHKPQELLPYF